MTHRVTNDGMNDAERIEAWSRVTDLETAVSEFLDHSWAVGHDPYYRDLNDALWVMLARCAS